MHKYFVSFRNYDGITPGWGRCEFTLPDKITTIEQIAAIEKSLCEGNDYEWVIVINYIYLGETYE